MRVALYCRVSTEDQARHGISIEAQLEALRQWAEREGHIIVGEYVDAGISGKKPPGKRPEMSRLFRDLDNGAKIDILGFCKLDRFFRSVKLYYQAVEVLDRYGVAWQAIQEDYETVTASGRMKVNIMLSVAENEADRTGERIKAVFEHKVSLGQAITGSCPFGFMLEDKRLVHSPDAPAAREAFELFASAGNVSAVRDMIKEKYGKHIAYVNVHAFLHNPLYKGEYRNNPQFCEPIISAELFDKVQKDFADRRKTKQAPSGRIYLFSGLVKCQHCGRRLSGCAVSKERANEIRYRCNGFYTDKKCTNRRIIREEKIEEIILQHVAIKLHEDAPEYQKREKKKSRSVDRNAIQKKLERLKGLYVDGDITKDEYTVKRDKLIQSMQEPDETKQMNLQDVLGKDFILSYSELPREEKRATWRKIIDFITIDDELNITVFFYS